MVTALLLSETATLWCACIPGHNLPDDFLKQLHSIREPSYQAHLKGDGSGLILDPRDRGYNHILMVSKADGRPFAGMRVMSSSEKISRASPEDSYLEYSFPGFYQTFSQRGSFLELSRLFIAVEADAKDMLFASLFRGVRLLADSISCHLLTGLVSYDHSAHHDLSNRYYIRALSNSRFFDDLPAPLPTHPLDFDLTLTEELGMRADRETHIGGVERSIQEIGEPGFRVSPITRIYLNFFRTRIMGFSMGKSYNGLTELLMHSDLRTHRFLQTPME